jgi:hypothetical protein
VTEQTAALATEMVEARVMQIRMEEASLRRRITDLNAELNQLLPQLPPEKRQSCRNGVRGYWTK